MATWPVVVEYAFYGMCLGAAMHIQVFYMSKCLNWIADAITGERLK